MPLTDRVCRAGVTLVELLVAMVLLAAVTAMAVATVVRQSSSTRAVSEIAELRDQLRDGTSVLAADLRGVSSEGGDIYPAGMTRTSVEFRSTFGSSVVCLRAASDQIALPPNIQQNDGRRFTWIYKRLDPGHGILIFDDAGTEAADDDVWITRSVAAVASTLNSCGGAPFASAADASLRGYQVTLDAALPPTVLPGSPVRLVERVRYALYQSGDNRWYLGYCASNNMLSGCGVLQPLSGPYSPPHPDASSGLSGLELSYHDADGATTADPFQVSRVDITLRASTAREVSLSGGSRTIVRDSSRISVNLRGR